MRITRSDFARSLEGKQVSLEKLSNDRGISSSAKERMKRADLNRDGFVTGASETNRLFSEVDFYDRDGNENSISTSNRNVAAVRGALLRSAEAPSASPSNNDPRTRLGELLANNPEIKDNQDLLNLFMRRNRNNWNAASTEASRFGVAINDLVRNREASVRDLGVTTTSTQSTNENTSAEGIGQVAGISNTSAAFRRKVVDVADRLQMDPTHLMAVMSFESGETFSSSARNRWTNATGLIQFMPATARRLGTTISELSQMSPERQLDYVEEYLQPYSGRMNTLEDAYMAVLWPSAVGKGPDRVLFRRGTRAYRQNKGLDSNNSGTVTVREATSKVRAKLQ